MAQAIKRIGLEPYFVDVSRELDSHVIKSTIYGYLKGKVPIILIGSLHHFNSGEFLGLHAITITGFNLPSQEQRPFGETRFLLEASQIDKIYAHDDQVGPFSRMPFSENGIEIELDNGNKISRDCLRTSNGDTSGNQAGRKFVPQYLLIPLKETIRLTMWQVHSMVLEFDNSLEQIKNAYFHKLVALRFSWQLYLTNVRDYKTDLLYNSDISAKQDFLTRPLPEFIWVAAIFLNNIKVVDLLFDTTEIRPKKSFLYYVVHDETSFHFIKGIAKQVYPKLSQQLSLSMPIWEKLAE